MLGAQVKSILQVPSKSGGVSISWSIQSGCGHRNHVEDRMLTISCQGESCLNYSQTPDWQSLSNGATLDTQILSERARISVSV